MLDRRHAIGSAAAALALAPARLLAAAPTEPNWRKLFNGRDLDGWTIFQQGVGNRDAHQAIAIDQGMLHFLGPDFDGPASATFGHIATVQEWHDFHLRLEFRWGERRFAPRGLQRRNSGVLYHMAPEIDRLFPDCVEFQVEEGDVGDAVMVNTKALQGPLLGGTPLWPTYFPGLPRSYQEPLVAGGFARQWLRHSGVYEKLDGWNTLDLYAFDDQAAHLVNGRIVTTLFAMIDRGAAPLKKGRIALEFEAAEVWFRNVAIRPIDATEIAGIKAGQ
ncbi:MAG: DUF1080 domain-containing protein [Novosphingobium sp.]